LSLDACLAKLRYVSYGDEVRASDVVGKLECLKVLRDTVRVKAVEFGCPPERVDPLVEQLDSIISLIPYVRVGDIIQPEHHNYIVDAIRKARDIIAEIESWCTGLKDQLDRCRADLDRCQADLLACKAIIELVYPVAVRMTPVLVRVPVVKPPDIEARTRVLEVKEIAVKPADVRNNISVGVSVSVTVS
jgi:hypothetical protein